MLSVHSAEEEQFVAKLATTPLKQCQRSEERRVGKECA